MKVNFLLFMAVMAISACQSTSESVIPINGGGGTLRTSIVPVDPNNPYDYVGNLHTNALDWIAIHVTNQQTSNSWANTFYTNWLSDSVQFNESYSSVVDSVMADSAVTLSQSASQGLSLGRISFATKNHIDIVGRLFDSLDVYDSTTFVDRIAQEVSSAQSSLTADTEKAAVLSVLSIGRASYLYWRYQFSNPTLTHWPLSRWNWNTKTKGQPRISSVGKGNIPQGLDPRTVKIINTDLNGAGRSIASDIVVTIGISVASGGTATIPTTGAVALKAALSGLAASAWYALWN